MTQDPLKAAWDNISTAFSNEGALKEIISRKNGPVLKAIRRQLIFESGCYTVFLAVYYDFFDGHTRPFYLNAVLVTAILLMLLHNVAGYFLAKVQTTDNSLTKGVALQLRHLKQYAGMSIASRLLGITGLLIFFTAGIHWSSNKYQILGAAIIIILFQLLLLWQIWSKRINKLQDTLRELSGQ
ncbi:MAG TPA: hypothetical protein VM802_24685 [Chitinophaga sp.]|uniref:hypothetical protein n=1 Tax=Chitinophaga sp. TaxID=1869181 RepID=UPI002CE4B813|nr:hypothetical protein [Chitinophaga sp.]HVI48087.1 hypothetical protein [Chitinophaga sp.]